MLRVMTTGNDQTLFKNAVKQWLMIHGLDYRWMADRCGVSEITVRNWMSQKNIPPLKQQLIERVMVQLPSYEVSGAQVVPGVSVNASLSLTVQLAPDMYKRLTERAMAAGLTPEALVAQTIAELVNTDAVATKEAGLKSRAVQLPPCE